MDGRGAGGFLEPLQRPPDTGRPRLLPSCRQGSVYESEGMKSGADRAGFVTRAKIAGLLNGDAGQSESGTPAGDRVWPIRLSSAM